MQTAEKSPEMHMLERELITNCQRVVSRRPEHAVRAISREFARVIDPPIRPVDRLLAKHCFVEVGGYEPPSVSF